MGRGHIEILGPKTALKFRTQVLKFFLNLVLNRRLIKHLEGIKITGDAEEKYNLGLQNYLGKTLKRIFTYITFSIFI